MLRRLESPVRNPYGQYGGIDTILEFLRIRPPMYSPPPEKEPSPDDNLYEDPDKNQPRRRQSRPSSQVPNLPESQLPSSAPPYSSHAYEHPISQEMRKQQQYVNSVGGPSSSKETTLSNQERSDDEARGLLRKNDSGGYYIASGSAHTTMSNVSPSSNRYEHSCLSRGPLVRMLPHHHYPGHESSVYDPSAPLHPHPSQINPVTTSAKRKKPGIREGFLATSASLLTKSSKKRKSSLTSEESKLRFYKYLCIFLFLLLLVTLFLLLALLIIRAKSTKDYAFYDKACSIYSSTGNFSDDPLAYSLPTSFKLGEFVSAILPPGQIVYSQFSVQRDGDVTFNVSVPPGARIVLYGRQTLEPTPAMNDFRHVIHADRLHLSGPMKRIKRSGDVEIQEKTQIFRSALITYYLMSGRWHLGFLNDGYQPLPIILVASLSNNHNKGGGKLSLYGEPVDECKYNCFNKGTCKDGKCHCFPGYNGKYCEETACPVLCSGNGIFTNGRCACHEGFKGPDCDLISSWCTVPHCNHHGRCIDGTCKCDRGWRGDFCDLPDCIDPTCFAHGICHEAKCYCRDGWHGENCEKSIFDVAVNCPVPTPSQEIHKPQSWSAEKSVEINKSPIKVEAKVEQDVRPQQNREIPQRKNEPVEQKIQYEGPDSTCSGRGRYDKKSRKCLCFEGFQGEICNQEKCSPDCLHGECHNRECICHEGWFGRQCSELKCLPGCELHGICNNGTCVCHPGWNGENCFIEGCAGNCSGGGACQSHFGQWKCLCDSIHYGENCQLTVETDCEDGIDNDNDGLIDCEDSECCTSRECSSSTLCTGVAQPRNILSKIQQPENANFYKRSKFLIEEESVQRFANQALFDENRVSIIRGHVVSKKGGPLTGVRISDVANARFGFSLSRSEDGGGAFDLLVNGGGRVTLQFLRHPYGKVEKSFYVPPNEIVFVGEVVMDDDGSKGDLFKDAKITANCKAFQLSHNISPSILPSWKLGQFIGGAFMAFLEMDSRLSRVLADSGIVNEKIPIASTSGAYLVYSSDRADGYRSTLHISLLGIQIPETLRLVHVQIQIAGRNFYKIFAAKPNLTYIFPWDQTNIYQQNIHGLIHTQISIGYEYEGCSGTEQIIWYHESIQLEGKKTRPVDFGPWSINFHHYFDFMNNVLERGEGRTIYLDETPPVLRTIVGSEERRDLVCKHCSKEALLGSKLFSPSAITIGTDGAIYIGDYDLVRRVSPDRKNVETILKLSTSDTSHPYYLLVDSSNGNLFVSMPLRRQIWQIVQLQNPSDPTTNYQVFAGDGSTCTDPGSNCGDGGPAESAQLFFPKGMSFDNDGNLFFIDGRRIRVITKQRQIRTLIKDKEWKPTSNGCDSSFTLEKLNLEWPTSIIFEPFSKNLIILDTDVIYKIDFSVKLVKILAGIPKGCEQSSHGLTPLKGAKSFALDSKIGILYISETDEKRINLIRTISINGGPIQIVAGKTGKCDCDKQNCPCDETFGEPLQTATSAMLHRPSALAVDLKGRLYIADQKNFKIKVMEKIQPEYDSKERLYKINSPETNEIYYFNQQGFHSKTVSLLSGQNLYNFTYSQDLSSPSLSEIKGSGGISIRINRLNNTDIVLEGSLAEKTHIKFNPTDKSLMESVSSDSLGKINFEYSTGQLLSAKISNGQPIFYDYDTNTGRVKNVTTSSGNLYRIAQEETDLQKLTTRVTLNERQFKRFSGHSNEFSEEGHTTRSLIRFPNAFILNASGIRTQFDGVIHPLLLPYENVILKRKIVVPELEEPLRRELTARFEWRANVRRGAGKRITQVNGVNVFTIEFDRPNLIDTIRDAYDNDLLSIAYSPTGQITSVIPAISLSLPTINVTYDNHGLPLSLEWLERRRDFVYDQKHRLILSTFGRQGDLLKRKYSYGKESSRNPSMVEVVSGDKYKWLYDSGGGVTALKTPSDEIHNFWNIVGLRPDIYWILHRQTPNTATKKSSYVAALNENGQLTHFVTPDQMLYLKVSRNDAGQIERVDADSKSVEYGYDNLGNLVSLTTSTFFKELVYQGPLIISSKYKPKSIPKENVYFAYEYDDLFRLTTIHANFDSTALEPLRFEYNSTSGRANKISRSSLNYDQGKRTIISDMFTLETSYTSDRLVHKHHLTLADSKVLEMEATYDTIGRPEALSWTIFGQRRPTESRTYTINGQIAQLNLGETENLRWTLHYDLDGRLKMMNELKLKLQAGGVPQKFGDVDYGVDGNGWVYKRGDFYFQYDVFGQVIRASNRKNSNVDILYEYDEQNRLITRKAATSVRVQRFYYAMPHKPELITHFVDSQNPDIIWFIHYTESNQPFFLESSSGSRFALVTDPLGSIRFIFNDQGLLSREFNYSPTGEAILDTNPSLYIPLGYLGHFHDFETKLIFVREKEFDFMVSRPLDGQIGRFLSTSLGILGQKIDVYQPEAVADPYGFGHGIRPIVIPKDPSSWLRLAGIDLDHLISFTNLESSTPNSCGIGASPIVSGAICSVEHDLTLFSQLMTMTPIPLLGKNGVKMIQNMDSQLADFSRDGMDIGNIGFSLVVDKDMKISLKPSKSADPATINILTSLLGGSELVNLDNFGIESSFRANNQTQFELHVITSKSDARDVTTTVSGTTTLTPYFNATIFHDRIELYSGATKIIVHFMKTSGVVWAELFQEKTREIEKLMWKSERDALRRGLSTKHTWTQEELKELSKNGRVPGYSIRYHPEGKNPILQNKALWRKIIVLMDVVRISQ
uniref:EGF-like domain-containing protein n=1 Tax=Acrobeloides nanus TaxID=290746 RepID=A0A914CCG1_9BILA